MNAKRIATVLMALAITLLPAVLSGCEGRETLSSSTESNPPASSEPSPTPEPTPEPTPSSEPTASPTPAAPAVDVDALFEENPIEVQKDEDLANASTGKAAYLAFQTARKSWTRFIDRLTDILSNGLLDGPEKEAFDKAAEDWSAERESAIQSVLGELSEEEVIQSDLDKATEVAAAVASLSRDRGLELCRKYVELTGEFPDFEELLSDAPMG